MKVTNELIVIDNYRKTREAERDAALAARLQTPRSTKEWIMHFRTQTGFRKKERNSSDKSVYFI